MSQRSFLLLSTVAIGGMLALFTYHPASAAEKFTLAPDRDTTVFPHHPQENFGSEPYLFLVYYSDPPSSEIPSKILIHFDVSSIHLNPGDRVDSAQLKLTQVVQRGWGSTPIRAHRLEDMFNGENQVVWDHPTAPFFDAESFNTWSEQSPRVIVDGLRFFRQTVTLDVRSIVRKWLEDGQPNNGMFITADVPNPCYCAFGVAFFSKESRANGSADLQDLTPRELGSSPTLIIGITRAGAR